MLDKLNVSSACYILKRRREHLSPATGAQFVGESDLYLCQLGLGQSFGFTELTF